MKNAVTIKANNFGLLIFLNPEMDFEELKKEVGNKFEETKAFFGNASMAVSFEERKLSLEEQEALIDEIVSHSDLKISCIIDKDQNKEKQFMEYLKKIELMDDTGMVKIYKGNFRSGKQMDFDTGVIIMGDVNPGAKVSARGNVIILGSLKGEAEAGIGGNDNTFIFALDMQPIQLRIGTKIARCSDGAGISSIEKNPEPQVAFVEDGNIYIEKYHKSIFDSLYVPE